MSVPFAFVGIVFIWSTTPLAIKWSGEDVGFLFGVAARMSVALLISLAIILLIRKKLPVDKASRHVYLAVGVPLYLAMSLCYWGAQYVSSGLVSVVFGLTPIFTGIAASIFLAEKSFSVFKILGIVMGLAGLALIFQESLHIETAAALGLLSLLAACIAHSLGTVWFKKVGVDTSAFIANTGGLIVCVFLFALTWLATGEKMPAVVPDYVMGSILYLGVFGSVIGAFLFFYALKKVKASTIGMLPLITPVAALVIGQWFNGEIISKQTLFGVMIILIGLVIYQWADEIFRKFLRSPLVATRESVE